MPIVLDKLSIDRINYGDNRGQYAGRIKFTGPKGDVALKLSDSQIKRIFSMCADSLVEATTEVATALKSEIITQSKEKGSIEDASDSQPAQSEK